MIERDFFLEFNDLNLPIFDWQNILNPYFECDIPRPEDDIIQINKINDKNNNKVINNEIQLNILRDENTNFTTNKNNKSKKNSISKNVSKFHKDMNKENLNKDGSKKKLLGRKTSNSLDKGDHDKYKDDNIMKKIRILLSAEISIFINGKIEELYKNNNGEKTEIKKLLKLSEIKYNVNSEKELLNKTLKNIFTSLPISNRFIHCEKNHNEKLIQKLLDENDVEKKIIFEKLLNLTFLDCLKHFRDEEKKPELEGMAAIEKICKKFNKYKDYENYVDNFKKMVNNYEKILNKKNGRIKNKIKQQNNYEI